jgi:hypothetical protein
MDEFTLDAFVNRDEPIPVLSFDTPEDLSDQDNNNGTHPETPERKRDRLWRHAANMKENVRKVQGKTAETGGSMQDRLLEKYFLPHIALAFTC